MITLGVVLGNVVSSVSNYGLLRVLLRFASFLENAVLLDLVRRRLSIITVPTSYRSDICKPVGWHPYMWHLAYRPHRPHLA